MITRWKSSLLLALVIFLMCLAPALGQNAPSSPSDLGWKLYHAYSAEDEKGFFVLFEQDPVLTKRAYAYVIQYAFEINRQGLTDQVLEALEFADILATLIDQKFQDPRPAQLMTQLKSGNGDGIEEAARQYDQELTQQHGIPATSEGLQGDDDQSQSASMDKQVKREALINTQVVRFNTKLLRTALATSLTDAPLALQELESFEPFFDDVEQKLSGDPDLWTKDLQEMIQLLRSYMGLFSQQIAAELGILHKFNSETLEFLKDERMADIRPSFYITGYRMALRQQQYKTAQSYIDKLKKDPKSNTPVHRFIIRSAEQQLRQAQGEEFTPEQILVKFNSAWSELATYKPGEDYRGDGAWNHGRFFTRFWIDQLTELETPKLEKLFTKIADDYVRWIRLTYELQGKSYDEQLEALAQLEGLFILYSSSADVMLHLFEEHPPLMKTLPKNVIDFPEQVIGFIVESAPELGLGGPGFPPFDLTNATMVKETRIRLAYIKGLNQNLPEAERVSILKEVLPMMEGLDLPEIYLDYHIKIGHTLMSLEQQDLALVAWEKAYRRAKELNFVSHSIEAASLLAEGYSGLGQWEKALIFASDANLGLQEELGTSQATSGVAMAKKNANLSTLGAKAAIKSNDPQKALSILAQGQQMNSAAIQLSGNREATAATKQLQNTKSEVASLSHKVQKLQELPASATRDEMIEKAQSLLAETRSEFLLQSRNIRQKFPKLYTSALRFDPLNLPDVQKALPPGTAVIQYFPTDEEIYIFVVSSDQFRLHSVKQNKAHLDSLTLAFLRRLQNPSETDDRLLNVSKELYEILITPIEDDLKGSDTLVLIPSGKLNILPFAALIDPYGKAFIEKKTLLELAKPTDFMKIAQTPSVPVKSVVAFANATSDLPAAEEEGRKILEIFPGSKLFIGEKASKEALMEFGNQAEVLHLATHGTWDASNSLNNHLKLSGGQNIAQEEIFDLDLDGTSIVTLSACSTALSDTQDVEYVASLAEAFWIAGSSSVIASLWAVEDTSTSLLMTKFYERLKAGDGRAKALQHAQLFVQQDPRFGHPYYWSGFLLFGDYR